MILGPGKLVSHICVGDEIGVGSFSSVYRAYRRDLPDPACVKIIKKSTIQGKVHADQISTEIRTLSEIHHPNIVKFYDANEDKSNIYLFMEYCEGISLLDFINNRPRIDTTENKKIFKQLLSALVYLHSKGISHRDIKPENVIIDADSNLKLIDFGFCKWSSENNLMTTCCGSLYYIAPETISGSPHLGPPTDVWSAGIILYALMTSTIPWSGSNQAQILQEISNGEYTIPMSLSLSCTALLEGLLDLDPLTRFTAKEAIDHVWFNEDQYVASQRKCGSFIFKRSKTTIEAKQTPTKRRASDQNIIRKNLPENSITEIVAGRIRVRKTSKPAPSAFRPRETFNVL